MKESCYKDYNMKIHGGNTITNQNYEENIDKMRVTMRQKSFLTKPYKEDNLQTMIENLSKSTKLKI